MGTFASKARPKGISTSKQQLWCTSHAKENKNKRECSVGTTEIMASHKPMQLTARLLKAICSASC